MNEYSAYVMSVIDGDTFKTPSHTIRLANINVPENDTLEGQRSTAYLKQLIEGKHVRIKSVATDVYRRVVAHVWRGSDSLFINKEMCNSGHANPM